MPSYSTGVGLSTLRREVATLNEAMKDVQQELASEGSATNAVAVYRAMVHRWLARIKLSWQYLPYGAVQVRRRGADKECPLPSATDSEQVCVVSHF